MFDKIQLVTGEGVSLPEYKTPLSSGFDVSAMSLINVYDSSNNEITPQSLEDLQDQMNEGFPIPLFTGNRYLIGTGLTLANLDPNLELQVRPRSGLALKHGLTVLNTPGTIDADYRGEIGIILINHSGATFQLKKGMRIAQIVCNFIFRLTLKEVSDTSPTERGEGGFGSTGK